MLKPNILIVDSDEGFGYMLTEGLQNTGFYTAKLVNSGADALESIVEHSFDMIIIDVGISDVPPPTLVNAVRETNGNIKIMMTPLLGQDLPAKVAKLDINGVLPKPFFVGDLPDLIDASLGQSRSRNRTPTPLPLPVQANPQLQLVEKSSGPASSTKITTVTESNAPAMTNVTLADNMVSLPVPFIPQETIRFLRASETEVMRLLNDLNRELRAEAILLIAGADLVANAGMLSKKECQELAILVAQSSQAAAHAATYLGERAGRFTQSLHEGGAYRLYTLTLAEGILLSLALSTNVPLGMIRHQSRQTAEQLSKFII
jgi:CheY-like chemotaxis protein